MEGTASYYDLLVDGKVNRGAVWCYPAPSPTAASIKDHVAFWHGVRVQRGDGQRPGMWQRLRGNH